MKTNSKLDRDALTKLQELIQINIDSRDGYLEAVEHTDSRAIAAALRELAMKHNKQASQLAGLVSLNFREPVEKGSVAAAVHRAWIKVRGAIGQGTQAMLKEAERGEDYMIGKYEKALQEITDSSVTDVLERQYRDTQSTRDSIRELCDSYAEGSLR